MLSTILELLPAILVVGTIVFNIIATLGTTYFAWKILQFEVTPPRTWSFKLVASLIGLIQIFWGALFVNDIIGFISTYEPSTLIVSYGLAALRTGLIYAFVRNVYYSLAEKFLP